MMHARNAPQAPHLYAYVNTHTHTHGDGTRHSGEFHHRSVMELARVPLQLASSITAR
jgi:hypothetical protein